MVYAYVDLWVLSFPYHVAANVTKESGSRENAGVLAVGAMPDQKIDKYFIRQAENANYFAVNSAVSKDICEENIILKQYYVSFLARCPF